MTPHTARPQVVVVGAGIMGRAVAWQLAQRGIGVLVVEQHGQDKATGHARTTNLALSYCHPQVAYSRLAMHAFTWWRVVERMTDTNLLTPCGELDIGSPGSPTFDERLTSVRHLGLDHEILSPRLVSRRFQCFHLPEGFLGIYHPGAVRIDGEQAMSSLYHLAIDSGADFLWDAQVEDYIADSSECRVRVGSGRSSLDVREIRCDRMIICAGPWTADLVGGWPPFHSVRHEFQSFSLSSTSTNTASDSPLFLIHRCAGENGGRGGAAASRHDECLRGDFYTDSTDPRVMISRLKLLPAEPSGGADSDPTVGLQELGDRVRRFVPALSSDGVVEGSHSIAATPDGLPCLDWLEAEKRVLLCAGFSSKGSLAPVVGAAVADMFDGGHTEYDIESARIARFTRSPDESNVT